MFIAKEVTWVVSSNTMCWRGREPAMLGKFTHHTALLVICQSTQNLIPLRHRRCAEEAFSLISQSILLTLREQHSLVQPSPVTPIRQTWVLSSYPLFLYHHVPFSAFSVTNGGVARVWGVSDFTTDAFEEKYCAVYKDARVVMEWAKR